MYWLGKALKETYSEVIPKEYNFSNFEIHSRNMDYQIEAAQCIVYGIFGLGKGMKIESDIPWHYDPPIYNY